MHAAKYQRTKGAMGILWFVAALFAMAFVAHKAHAATVAYVNASAAIQHEGLDLELKFSVAKPAAYSTPMPTAVRPTLSNGVRTITLEPQGASWSDVGSTLDWNVFYSIPDASRVLYSESSGWSISWSGGALFADSDGNATPASGVSVAVTSKSRVDSNGWTVYNGTFNQTYYIAANGSDSNNGTSTGTAFATVAKAKSMLVNGQSIKLAFRRGDTWNEGFGRVQVSGTSATQPILVTYYGASGNPPRFVVPNGANFLNSFGAAVNHWAVVGVDVDGNQNYSVDWKAPTVGLRLEGCRFYNGHTNLTFEIDGALLGQSYTTTGVDNVNVYRCVNIDAHTAGHSHGTYAFGARGFRAVECVYDHNGWIGGTTPSDQNHNFYFHAHTEGWRILRTLSLRSAGNGWSMNCPGWAAQSYVFAANSGCQQRGDVQTTGPFPSTSGLARVVVEGGANSTNNGNAGEPRSLALGIHFNQHWTESRPEWPGFAPLPGPQTATGCAVIQKISTVTGDAAAYVFEAYNGAGTPRKFGLINSTAYRWRDRDVAVIGNNDSIEVRNSTFVENATTQPRGHLVATYAGQFPAPGGLYKFSGNYYTSASPASAWFGYNEGFTSISQAAWSGMEPTASFTLRPMQDASRNLAAYHASIGGVATADAFIAAARAMNVFTWDSRYTGRAVSEWVLAGLAPPSGGGGGTAPNTPTNFRATGQTSTTVTLACDAPGTGGGAGAALGYAWRRMNGATVLQEYLSSGPSITITGLASGSGFDFRVAATNASGAGTATAAITVRTAPAVVAGLAATPVAGGVNLACTPSGSPFLAAYKFYYSTNGGATFALAGSSPSPALEVPNLAPNPTQFRVTQVDTFDLESDPSASITATPLANASTPPGIGNGVNIVAIDEGLVVNWAAANTATQYRVRWGTVQGKYTQSAVVNAPTTSFVITGLTNLNRYHVIVEPINAQGAGPPSSNKSGVPQKWWLMRDRAGARFKLGTTEPGHQERRAA